MQSAEADAAKRGEEAKSQQEGGDAMEVDNDNDEEEMDPDLAAAMALSMQGIGGDDVAMEEADDDHDFEDMDEELRLAIELSKETAVSDRDRDTEKKAENEEMGEAEVFVLFPVCPYAPG